MGISKDVITPDFVLSRFKSPLRTDRERISEDPNFKFYAAGIEFGKLLFQYIYDRETDLSFSPPGPSGTASMIAELHETYIKEVKIAQDALQFAADLIVINNATTAYAHSISIPFAKTTLYNHRGIMVGFGIAAFASGDFPTGVAAISNSLGQKMLYDPDVLESIRTGLGSKSNLELAVAFQIANELNQQE